MCDAPLHMHAKATVLSLDVAPSATLHSACAALPLPPLHALHRRRVKWVTRLQTHKRSSGGQARLLGSADLSTGSSRSTLGAVGMGSEHRAMYITNYSNFSLICLRCQCSRVSFLLKSGRPGRLPRRCRSTHAVKCMTCCQKHGSLANPGRNANPTCAAMPCASTTFRPGQTPPIHACILQASHDHIQLTQRQAAQVPNIHGKAQESNHGAGTCCACVKRRLS